MEFCGDAAIRVWSADGKARGARAVNDALLTKVACSADGVACSADGKVVVSRDYAGKTIAWDGVKIAVLRGLN